MDARIDYCNAVAAKFAKYINSAGGVVTDSTLPAATQELVKIRASQVNGCAAWPSADGGPAQQGCCVCDAAWSAARDVACGSPSARAGAGGLRLGRAALPRKR
jgi:hypothetical protein